MINVVIIIIAVLILYSVVTTFVVVRLRKRNNEQNERMKALQADVKRKNAALITIADNAKKVRNEKARIAKSDLDQLIDIAYELSDMVPESSRGKNGTGNPDPGTDTISGKLVDG